MPTAIANQAILSDKVEYMTVQELAQCKALDTSYIRGFVSPEAIDKKIEQLTFSSVDGSLPVVRIVEPLIIWFDGDGNQTVVDGNTRRAAIVNMLNTTKYQGYEYQEVPYRRMLIPPTTENLIQLQVIRNDTTTPHSLLQMARIVQERREFYVEYGIGKEESPELAAIGLKCGLSATKASAQASAQIAAMLNKTPAYVSNLLKVANAPEWLLDKIEIGEITFDPALKLMQGCERVQYPLEVAYSAIAQTLNPGDTIYAKNVKAFFDGLNADDEEPAKGDTSEEKTSEDSLENHDATKSTIDVESAMTHIDDVSSILSAIEPESVDPVDNPIFARIAQNLAKANAIIATGLPLSNGFDLFQLQFELMESLVAANSGMIVTKDDDESAIKSIYKIFQAIGKDVVKLSSAQEVETQAVSVDNVADEDEEEESEYEGEEEESEYEGEEEESEYEGEEMEASTDEF